MTRYEETKKKYKTKSSNPSITDGTGRVTRYLGHCDTKPVSTNRVSTCRQGPTGLV